MNKPYFTKYLPVEGEIKEGDKFLLNNHHPQGQLRIAYKLATLPYWDGKSWDNEGLAYYIDPIPQDGAGFVHWNECKLAKLVLCSRDIKVGDEVTHRGSFEKGIVLEVTKDEYQLSCDNKGHYSSKNQWMKVIGEVFKEAIWVTADMEFDEDEVKKGYMITNDPKHPSFENYWYFFKCPTCLKFH